MRYGIIGAMPVEIEKIKNTMTIEKTTDHHGLTFYEGSVEGRQIVLTTFVPMLMDTAGNSGSQTSVTVIRGLSLGEPDIHVKDVVIGTSTTTFDVGPDIMGRYFPFCSNYQYDPEIIEAAKAACESITDRSWKYVTAPTITGDMFVTDSGLKARFLGGTDAYCNDMEAQAMAQIAFIYKVPIANIRSISDNADDEATATYKENEAAAAEVAATVLLETLKRLPA